MEYWCELYDSVYCHGNCWKKIQFTFTMCLQLTLHIGEFNKDHFCECNDDGCNLEVRKQTRIQTPNFIAMFRCNAGKGRHSNKVRGESSPCMLPGRRSWRTFSFGASRSKILCVYSKPGEAVSLCDRQRRVFDPGYLASSTLSQPLEPSQGNWLTVWSDSAPVQDDDKHTRTRTRAHTSVYSWMVHSHAY